MKLQNLMEKERLPGRGLAALQTIIRDQESEDEDKMSLYDVAVRNQERKQFKVVTEINDDGLQNREDLDRDEVMKAFENVERLIGAG